MTNWHNGSGGQFIFDLYDVMPFDPTELNLDTIDCGWPF